MAKLDEIKKSFEDMSDDDIRAVANAAEETRIARAGAKINIEDIRPDMSGETRQQVLAAIAAVGRQQ